MFQRSVSQMDFCRSSYKEQGKAPFVYFLQLIKGKPFAHGRTSHKHQLISCQNLTQYGALLRVWQHGLICGAAILHSAQGRPQVEAIVLSCNSQSNYHPKLYLGRDTGLYIMEIKTNAALLTLRGQETSAKTHALSKVIFSWFVSKVMTVTALRRY